MDLNVYFFFKTLDHREFPGSPVVRTPDFTPGGMALVPWPGTKILQAMRCSKTKQKTKRKQTLFKLKKKILDHNLSSENIPATRCMVSQHPCHSWLGFLLK